MKVRGRVRSTKWLWIDFFDISRWVNIAGDTAIKTHGPEIFMPSRVWNIFCGQLDIDQLSSLLYFWGTFCCFPFAFEPSKNCPFSFRGIKGLMWESEALVVIMVITRLIMAVISGALERDEATLAFPTLRREWCRIERGYLRFCLFFLPFHPSMPMSFPLFKRDWASSSLKLK